MIIKLLEVRDKGTFIPVVAIQFQSRNEAERYLLSASGYGKGKKEQQAYIIVAKLTSLGEYNEMSATYDPTDWGINPRTMYEAHIAIIEDWDTLESGDVVDVEYHLGETKTKKLSQNPNK